MAEESVDIVERLRNPPEDTHHTSAIALMSEAADVIEALRALGKAAVGPSFADVAKDMRHEAPRE